MRTATEMAERLRELKRTNVPRASLARVDTLPPNREGAPRWSDVLPADLHQLVDDHLRHFAWMLDANGERICPGCETRGWFSWGVIHGSGSCSCGWPGRLYHLVHDSRPEAVCERCDRPRADHVPTDIDVLSIPLGAVGSEGIPAVRQELVCPGASTAAFRDTFRAPLAAKFDVLLWAHPYDVGVRGDR